MFADFILNAFKPSSKVTIIVVNKKLIKIYLELFKDRLILNKTFNLKNECFWISLKDKSFCSGSINDLSNALKNTTFMIMSDVIYCELELLNQFYHFCFYTCENKDGCKRENCFNCSKLIDNKRLFFLGNDSEYEELKDRFESKSIKNYYSEEFFNKYFLAKKLVEDYSNVDKGIKLLMNFQKGIDL